MMQGFDYDRPIRVQWDETDPNTGCCKKKNMFLGSMWTGVAVWTKEVAWNRQFFCNKAVLWNKAVVLSIKQPIAGWPRAGPCRAVPKTGSAGPCQFLTYFFDIFLNYIFNFFWPFLGQHSF